MAEEYWRAKYVNELVRTFILVLFGDGAVVVSVLTGAGSTCSASPCCGDSR